MNSEVKQLWIEELRSGRHEQGQGALHLADDSKCCLGVLCWLYDTRVEKISRRATDGTLVLYAEHIGMLPPVVERWAGIEDQSGYIEAIDQTLAALNDSGEYSFEQIASIIEEHL